MEARKRTNRLLARVGVCALCGCNGWIAAQPVKTVRRKEGDEVESLLPAISCLPSFPGLASTGDQNAPGSEVICLFL